MLHRLVGGAEVVGDHRIVAVGVGITVYQHDRDIVSGEPGGTVLIHKKAQHQQAIDDLIGEHLGDLQRVVVLVHRQGGKEQVHPVAPADVFDAHYHFRVKGVGLGRDIGIGFDHHTNGGQAAG